MRFFDLLFQDLRFAIRSFRLSPTFAVVTILSLGLGIGANTAIFSLLNAVMLKSLPVKDPQQLVTLSIGQDRDSFTNPIWEQIRDRQTAFDGVLAWATRRFNLSRVGETRFVDGILASGSFFDVIGVKAIAGRTFTPDDDHRGCGSNGPLAVVSYGFAQREFGDESASIGKMVSINDHPFTVIGVTPPSFYGVEVGQRFDIIAPICSEAILGGAGTQLDNRSSWWLTLIGRLKPGGSVESAQAAMRATQDSIREATIPPNWPPEYLKDYLKDPFVLLNASNGSYSSLRDRYTRALYVLMIVVALVLLVGCANIANLMLARSVARSKEIAVRVSMGASRFRLLRQLLVESVSLALVGAVAGILTAKWASRILVAQLATATTRPFLDLTLDWRVLAFTTSIGVITGVLFGMAPALRAATYSPADTLRQMTRTVVSADGRGGVSRGLVVVQVGVSLVLLIGAALFIRSYDSLRAVNPGFNPKSVLLVNIDIRRAVNSPEQRLALYDRLLETVRATPGVQKAAISAVTPISGSTWTTTIQVDGYSPANRGDSSLFLNYVSPDYLNTMETPIIAGRDFNSGDTASSPKVAIINETAAKRFFAGKKPIGLSYRARQGGTEWASVEIVGIARDAKYRSIREVIPPTAYLPFPQNTPSGLGASIVVKSAAGNVGLSPTLTKAITAIDTNIPITYRTLETQILDSLVQDRLMATLSALFGVLAITIAAVGLAGVVSYSVTRRRGEIGIRAALGASPGSIVWLVLRDVAILTTIGLIAGTAASVATVRFVSSMLYGLTPYDSSTIAIAIGALAVIAVVAGYVPARRATRIDAMECLRSE